MSNFSVGDRVRSLVGNSWIRKGNEGTIESIDGNCLRVEWDDPKRNHHHHTSGIHKAPATWSITADKVEKVENEQPKPQFVEVDFRVPQDLYELLEAIAYEHGLETETLINYCLTDSILHNKENDY